MGAKSSKIAFEICSVTGDYKVAEQGPTITLHLYDRDGNASPAFTLSNAFFQEEDGSIRDKFTIPLASWCKKGFGKVQKIEFWRSVEPGVEHVNYDWFCEKVIIRDRRKGLGGKWLYSYFPVHRWIHPDRHYYSFDCQVSLPSADPMPDERIAEISERRNNLLFYQRANGLPLELQALPAEEIFSQDTRWNIEKTKDEIIYNKGLDVDYASVDHFTSFDDLTTYYRAHSITEPLSVQRWPANPSGPEHDLVFGAQRLKGCNPFVIKVCKSIPDNFGVAVEWLKPYLEGWTLQHILDARRLFIVDYSIMEGVECKNGRQFCSPIALFFWTERLQLVPLAIQLNQRMEEGAPIMPSDSPHAWLQAKLWFNLTDACYHLVANRLLHHLILEGIYVTMRKNLSQSHPLYQMLAPHFRHLLAVNAKLKEWFFSDSGWIAQNIQLSRKGIRQLLKKAFKAWRFDQQINIYRELENRGVYDSNVLPGYPYREDAMLIYKAIAGHCDKAARLYYANPMEAMKRKLMEDIELQGWWAEMTNPLEKGGLGLKGLPGKSGIQHVDELIPLLTNLMYMICVHGSAAWQPQFDEYGFPPNYPLALHGCLPQDPQEEQPLEASLQSLPCRREFIDTVLSFRLCQRQKGEQPLGEYELQYSHDQASMQILQEFKDELARASATVKSRNGHRDPLYIYEALDPQKMLNYLVI
ncbi:hypothetical protein BOX15_Mlig014613g1 [Macrostomum lignano]|uniref:Lipoxygenase domain-containing protein n=2 Tax=Macrostomum lignano TaxID=282301 RepID=A0A1I8H3P0_9PLAT|nr:hypothetical protein BOX15_Mlig014613g1 [Macrostomum lignano]